MLSFKTHFHACAVKFSPFVGDLVAVATAQNFGIIGNGQQLILRVTVGDRTHLMLTTCPYPPLDNFFVAEVDCLTRCHAGDATGPAAGCSI